MAKKLFTKGMAKPAGSGRQQGTKNKKTIAINLLLSTAMNELSKDLIEDINSANSNRRLQLFTDLMNYINPKLSHNKNDDSVEHSGGINISVSFEDLLNPTKPDGE